MCTNLQLKKPLPKLLPVLYFIKHVLLLLVQLTQTTNFSVNFIQIIFRKVLYRYKATKIIHTIAKIESKAVCYLITSDLLARNGLDSTLIIMPTEKWLSNKQSIIERGMAKGKPAKLGKHASQLNKETAVIICHFSVAWSLHCKH